MSDLQGIDDLLHDASDDCQSLLLHDESGDEDDDLLYNYFWPVEDYLLDENDSDDEMLTQSFECTPQQLILDEPAVDSTTSLTAVSKIEEVFEAIADAMLAEGSPDLVLPITVRPKIKASSSSRSSNPRSGQIISFPGKTPEEAWRFTAIVRVLEFMHEALIAAVVTTKRDIYYRDPALFKSQSAVDRIVDDIAYSFEVPRAALNVIASAKGLVSGAIAISRNGTVLLDGQINNEVMLIPNLENADVIDYSSARWILVVEKEAVFRTILSSDFWASSHSHGIMLTGKGYPDIASRALLKRLSSSILDQAYRVLPSYCVFDYDPDGMAILSTYRHGSAALRHESSNLAVPQLQWLGLRSNDALSDYEPSDDQAMLTLSLRDRRKATKMLAWPHLNEDIGDVELRREAQIMLMLNQKAEIELLESRDIGVAAWMRAKLESS